MGQEQREYRLARDFRDLEVYRLARSVARAVYGASQQFPRSEMYALTSQINRAVTSIGAQIAEAWGKRQYPRHFSSKLSDADAECNETQHWLETACERGYLSSDESAQLIRQLQSINRMLNAMIAKAESFALPAGHTLHEADVPYRAEPDDLPAP